MDLGEGVSGPKAKKSQKKSRKKSPGAGLQKSEKSLGKGPKVKKESENGFLETFRTFCETLFGLLQPDPGRLFQDFFETFGLLARDSLSQVHGTVGTSR